MSETIGDRIKQLRGDATRAQFADRLDVSVSTLTRWEKNETRPDSDNLICIQRLSGDRGVNLEWLVNGYGEIYYHKDNIDKSAEEDTLNHEKSRRHSILCIVKELDSYRDMDTKKRDWISIDVIEAAAKMHLCGYHVHLKVKAI